MPRIPILRLRRATEALEPPVLTGYAPALALDGLQPGVDNLRYDVHLSRGFVEQTRVHIARLIVRHAPVRPSRLSAAGRQSNWYSMRTTSS